ncbi:sulfatase, partial [Ornithobacterium rhinotracheale]
DPRNLGFDVNVAGDGAGQPASYYGEDCYADEGYNRFVYYVRDLEPFYYSDTFLSDSLTLEA